MLNLYAFIYIYIYNLYIYVICMYFVDLRSGLVAKTLNLPMGAKTKSEKEYTWIGVESTNQFD